MGGGVLLIGPIASLLSAVAGLLVGASWLTVIALFLLAGPVAVGLAVIFRTYVCTGENSGDSGDGGRPLE